MNWGKKILIVYSAFVLGIVFLVFKASSQKTDMVTTDYYAKELKYQEQIDKLSRTNALSEKIKYEIKDNQLLVRFPKEFNGKKISGNVKLYCPSDENKDSNHQFSSDNSSTEIVLPTGSKGLFELHISWLSDGISYYYEEKIFV